MIAAYLSEPSGPRYLGHFPTIEAVRAAVSAARGVNMQSRDDIIAEILELMASYGLTWADIEEPENLPEPETVSEH